MGAVATTVEGVGWGEVIVGPIVHAPLGGRTEGVAIPDAQRNTWTELSDRLVGDMKHVLAS